MEFMPAAKLALLAGQTAVATGCGLSKTPQSCPILTSKGYMYAQTTGGPSTQLFEPPLSQQDVACEKSHLVQTCLTGFSRYK
eukprot:761851-Hanusia_phi.AAC.3